MATVFLTQGQGKDNGVKLTRLGSLTTDRYQISFYFQQISQENDGITTTSDVPYSSRERKHVCFNEQAKRRIIVVSEPIRTASI